VQIKIEIDDTTERVRDPNVDDILAFWCAGHEAPDLVGGHAHAHIVQSEL
jgi:hypothetical protein